MGTMYMEDVRDVAVDADDLISKMLKKVRYCLD